MEITIAITGSIIIPTVMVVALLRIRKKQQAKEAIDQELISTLEAIVEEKSKTIQKI